MPGQPMSEWDEEIPEECPEFVPVLEKCIPGEKARMAIAESYLQAVAARKLVRQGVCSQQTEVMEFAKQCRAYLNRALLIMRGHPAYQQEPEDLLQDLHLACVLLLDEDEPLRERQTCCLGTQIYNSLNWRIRRLASQNPIRNAQESGLDDLGRFEPIHEEDPTQGMFRSQMEHRIEIRFGRNMAIWMRGRYIGNDLKEMKEILGLPPGEAMNMEELMHWIVTKANQSEI